MIKPTFVRSRAAKIWNQKCVQRNLSYAYLPGAGGSLTTAPENAVVLRGEDAILNCSTDAGLATGLNPIAWTYDNDIISYSPCTSQHPGFVASASDSATDCNIRALGSWQYGISGAYKCSDGTTQAVATLIVLGERNYSLFLFLSSLAYCQRCLIVLVASF